GRRTYLPPAEASILRVHLERFCARAADARVFTSTTGRHLDTGHLQERAWRPARELAFPDGHRLHRVGRHAFRHLAVTRWLRAGVPLRTAARWGGWNDVATMLRWYESRLPGDDLFAASRMSTPVQAVASQC
ncbi:MAG: tyrosine-type recombinase/integrase, partial [Actinobacteria bacterium]|nr:tyrosine-type recombinase/integrase [Actinomycetota bacterium]